MDKTASRTILFIILILYTLLPVSAQSLRYVYSEYYPANYLDENGEPAGFFVDIITEALTNRMGIPVTIDVFPWRRCQNLIRNGEADMITTIPTIERLSYATPTDTPIWIKRYHLYTWSDHPSGKSLASIQNLQDLACMELSVISYLGNNWSESTLEKAGITVIYATTVESMYRMLNARRGDVIIDDPILVDPALKFLDLNETIIRTCAIVAESSFHPLIGKRSPFVDRVDELNTVLLDMWNDGTIERILEKYRTR